MPPPWQTNGGMPEHRNMALLQYDRLGMDQSHGYGVEGGSVAVVGSERGGDEYVKSAVIVGTVVDFSIEFPDRADVVDVGEVVA